MNHIREKGERQIFECQCCGHCCHGQATVSVSQKEQKAIAEYMGLDLKDLADTYLNVKEHCTEMKVINGHCIFYGEDGLCKIHPVKPFHCRRWPLHPSILNDESAWKAIRRDCPGFRQDAGYEDVCAFVKEWLNGFE